MAGTYGISDSSGQNHGGPEMAQFPWKPISYWKFLGKNLQPKLHRNTVLYCHNIKKTH